MRLSDLSDTEALSLARGQLLQLGEQLGPKIDPRGPEFDIGAFLYELKVGINRLSDLLEELGDRRKETRQ